MPINFSICEKHATETFQGIIIQKKFLFPAINSIGRSPCKDLTRFIPQNTRFRMPAKQQIFIMLFRYFSVFLGKFLFPPSIYSPNIDFGYIPKGTYCCNLQKLFVILPPNFGDDTNRYCHHRRRPGRSFCSI